MLCLICSCSPEIIPKNTGVKADEELLEQIKKELEEKKQPILAEEGDVFWTPSGSIWHTTYECGSWARSEVILHGTVEEAKIMGKEKLCTRCEKAAILDSYDDDEIELGDVFWTEDGGKWHINPMCARLVGAEKVYHSSVEEAIIVGKVGPCSSCSGR